MYWVIVMAILFPVRRTLRVADVSDELYEEYARTYPGRIRGPALKSSRIAVVGAGPSGLHMAYLLKEAGFKNIQILEKSSRLGGKSKSVRYRGAIHEMGTVYLTSDYEQNALHLIKKFDNDQLISPPMPFIWASNLSHPLPFPSYLMLDQQHRYPKENSQSLNAMLKRNVLEYIQIHRSLFGTYRIELMSEPSIEVKHLIRGSFRDFLQRYNLLDLQSLFLATFTMQGYGRLEEVPALYGLMWNTPDLMLTLLRRISGKDAGLYLLKNGFQRVWTQLARRANLTIRYNVDIAKIVREKAGATAVYPMGGVLVFMKDENVPEVFDFLVWSPSAKVALSVFKDDSRDCERFWFSNISHFYYTTSLVSTNDTVRSGSPIDWWYTNVLSGEDMKVWAQRDSYAVANGQKGASRKWSDTPTGNGSMTERSSVYYQFSTTMPTISGLQQELRHHLELHKTRSWKVHLQINWPYFPHFSLNDTNHGIHWRILDGQGHHNTWFVGSSVSFESIKSVIEYNQLLISRMIDPEV